MIIWLSSYPRSGNTLTRQILWRVFGQCSYSRYGDPRDIAASAHTARETGHLPLPADAWPEARARLDLQPGPAVVKTHHPPESAAKAIYVVRHPCAAVVSFVHYQRQVQGRELTPEQILLGLPRGINWGGHLDDWQPLTRPDTLLLRFEDLVTRPQAQIERIAAFTGFKPVGRWHNDFDALRQHDPAFFRRGQVEPPWDELGGEGRRLLELVHGDWIERLGYGDAQAAADAALLRKHLQAAGQYLVGEERKLRAAAVDAAAARSAAEPQHPPDRARRPRPPAAPASALLQRVLRRVSRAVAGSLGGRPDPTRWRGKRVIAFSVFGDDPVYRRGAIANAEAAPTLFPGWIARFYASEEIPDALVERLRGLGSEVVRKRRKAVGDGLLWRFLPAGEAGLDALMVRDVDALLNARDKAAVDAWLDSGKGFHIIRDHPAHQSPILAGLWGCRGGRLSRIAELVDAWPDVGDLGCDQRFLAAEVYPLIAGDALIHSDFVAFGDEQVEPIPAPRGAEVYLGFPAERGPLSERRLASFERGRGRGLLRLPAPAAKTSPGHQ